MKRNHTISVTHSGRSPQTILSDTKRINNSLGSYFRGLETKDFIFFCNYQEGDENACIMMYRKDDFSLVSNNYFAYGAMFEILDEKENEITYISPTMKQNLRLYKETQKA